MGKETLKYIRAQMLVSGASNALLNAVFTWLLNRQMAFTPRSAVAVDTFFTTGFVSCLVTFPTAYFTCKAIGGGLPLATKENGFVIWLPRKPVRLWLLLWLSFFVLFEILLFVALKAAGCEGLEFLPLVISKFILYGVMGACLAAVVAFRQLQPARETSQKRVERRERQSSNPLPMR